MDRGIVYPFEEVDDTDILIQNRSNMIGLAQLSEAMIGTGPALYGLACTQTSPPSMNVDVAPGQIYSQQPVDATDYGSLPPDTTQIVKQGIILTTTTLSCPAPLTVGYSINYLVQIAFSETDTDAATRSFYNSALTPPNYTQTVDQYRVDQCIVEVKAGAAATTGTQVTPAPDTGFVGAWVVTVAYGQTTITSGDISEYPSAPFIPATLADALTQSEAAAIYLTQANAATIYLTQANAATTYLTETQGDARYVQITNNQFIGFLAYVTGTHTIAPTTPTLIPFNSTGSPGYNVGGYFDTSTSRFTPLVQGYYLFGGNLQLNSMAANKIIEFFIFKNATSVSQAMTETILGGNTVFAAATIPIYMNGTTDYVEMSAYQDDTVARTIDTVPDSTFFWGYCVSRT
jgi:hypothetical protein